METNSSFRTRAYYYFVVYLTTCSNLDKCALKLHSNDKNVASFVETFCCFPFLS